jgi:hypothetical protein
MKWFSENEFPWVSSDKIPDHLDLNVQEKFEFCLGTQKVWHLDNGIFNLVGFDMSNKNIKNAIRETARSNGL